MPCMHETWFALDGFVLSLSSLCATKPGAHLNTFFDLSNKTTKVFYSQIFIHSGKKSTGVTHNI